MTHWVWQYNKQQLYLTFAFLLTVGQEQEKLPCVFVHVCSQGAGVAAHSSTSIHREPVTSAFQPWSHTQRYEPIVFMHRPCAHASGITAHSSTSVQKRIKWTVLSKICVFHNAREHISVPWKMTLNCRWCDPNCHTSTLTLKSLDLVSYHWEKWTHLSVMALNTK